MPGFDRTGPAGAGPLTGWGEGDCRPQDAEVEWQEAGVRTTGRPMRRRLFLYGRRWARMGGRGRRGRGRGSRWF
jgi:hypothetical protein